MLSQDVVDSNFMLSYFFKTLQTVKVYIASRITRYCFCLDVVPY